MALEILHPQRMCARASHIGAYLFLPFSTFAGTSHSESNIQMEIKRPDSEESNGYELKKEKR